MLGFKVQGHWVWGYFTLEGLGFRLDEYWVLQKVLASMPFEIPKEAVAPALDAAFLKHLYVSMYNTYRLKLFVHVLFSQPRKHGDS